MREEQTGPAGVLPAVRVRRVLPPGAVRRRLSPTTDRDDHGASLSGPGEPGLGTAGAGGRPGGPGFGAARAPGPGAGWSGAAEREATRVGGVRSRVGMVVAGGGVVLVVAAAAVGLTGSGGTGDSGSRLPNGAAVPQLALEAAEAGRPVEVGVRLPAGPEQGRVRALPAGAAAEEQVVRLAAALGLDGRPERSGAGWRVAGSGAVLVVADSAGNPWQFRTGAADPPVVALPDSPVSAPAGRPGPRPVAREVRDAALPVLAAIGLDGADLRYEAGAGTRDAVAAPVVDGLPTSGLETRLQYGPGPVLLAAAGRLGRAEPTGPAYPLLSAEEVLATRPAAPEIACQSPADPACAPPVVVDARPGLVLRPADRDQVLLVPAWLFSLRGGGAPLAAVSVDPAHLAEPPTDPDTPTTDDGAAGSDGSRPAPGATEPGSPGPQPDPGDSEPGAGTKPGASGIEPGGSAPEMPRAAPG